MISRPNEGRRDAKDEAAPEALDAFLETRSGGAKESHGRGSGEEESVQPGGVLTRLGSFAMSAALKKAVRRVVVLADRLQDAYDEERSARDGRRGVEVAELATDPRQQHDWQQDDGVDQAALGLDQ